MTNVNHFILFRTGKAQRLPLDEAPEITGRGIARPNRVLMVEAHVPPDRSDPQSTAWRSFGVMAIPESELEQGLKIGFYTKRQEERNVNLGRHVNLFDLHPVINRINETIFELKTERDTLTVRNNSNRDHYEIGHGQKKYIAPKEKRTWDPSLHRLRITHPESGVDFIIHFPTVKQGIAELSKALRDQQGINYSVAPLARVVRASERK